MTIFKEIDSNLLLYIERLINGRINETFRLPFFFHVHILNLFILLFLFFSLKENMMSYDRPWITWITSGSYCPFSIIHTFLAFSLLYHFLYFLTIS